MTKYIITKEFRGAKRWWTGALFSVFKNEVAVFASKPAADAQIHMLKLASAKVERLQEE